MITFLAVIFVLLLLIGMVALLCEAAVYMIPVMLFLWIFKRLDKYFDSKNDHSQK